MNDTPYFSWSSSYIAIITSFPSQYRDCSICTADDFSSRGSALEPGYNAYSRAAYEEDILATNNGIKYLGVTIRVPDGEGSMPNKAAEGNHARENDPSLPTAEPVAPTSRKKNASGMDN